MSRLEELRRLHEAGTHAVVRCKKCGQDKPHAVFNGGLRKDGTRLTSTRSACLDCRRHDAPVHTRAIWRGMRDRCNNPKNNKYHRYGGRGIVVCARWANYDAFVADMGLRPCHGMTIERVDNDGDYEPANCKWIPLAEQPRNMSSNVRLTHNGETLHLADWARKTGLAIDAISKRLRAGWSVDRALTEPPQQRDISDRVLRALVSLGRPATTNELAMASGHNNPHSVRHMLRGLKAKGLVLQSAAGWVVRAAALKVLQEEAP